MDKIELETAEIRRLESMSEQGMTEEELLLHITALKDAYWRRRMASRTEEEVKKGVCAP